MFDEFGNVMENIPWLILAWYWGCGIILGNTPGSFMFLGVEFESFFFKALFGPIVTTLTLFGYGVGFLLMTFPIWAGSIYLIWSL